MKKTLLTAALLTFLTSVSSQSVMSAHYIKFDGVDGESKANGTERSTPLRQKNSKPQRSHMECQNNLKQLTLPGAAQKGCQQQQSNGRNSQYGPVITVKPKG